MNNMLAGRARRDGVWFVPAVVAGAAMAIPGAMTVFAVGVLYTFGYDSCGPGSGSGTPCPDQVSSPWLAEWAVALVLGCLTLAPPRQTRFHALRWLLAAGAVTLAWMGSSAAEALLHAA